MEIDMADAIVFTQNELTAAINGGASDILLCDNSFILPPACGVKYTAIGNVTALADFDSAEALSIVCLNFMPKIKKRPKTVHISNKVVGAASITSSFALSSYSSSYKFGSYASSYSLSGLGSYVMSFRFAGSYTHSSYRYKTSYSGSYSAFYRLTQSYKSSFSTSFMLSSFMRGFKRKLHSRVLKEISVNGYGIHLI